MEHNITKVSDSHLKVAVAVDKDAWKDAQAKAFDKEAEKVTVPGFRKGKAPKALVAERIGQEAIWNTAIDSLLSTVLVGIISEENIQPFYRPDVSVTKLSGDELELVYDIITIPSVTLGAYTGLSAKKEAPSVTDKEVDDAIADMLKGNAELEVVDREAKIGDTTIIDFDGYLADENGKLSQFEGGQANNYSLELGSHSFIPGFEEQLVGMKDGDKKDIKVTFPTNYVKELAGKEATFKIAMHEVKEKKVPELSDETVKDLMIPGVENVDGLRDHERKTILERKVRESENAFYTALIHQIVDSSTFVIDPSIIANEAANMENNLKKQIESQGLTFEQYLEITGAKEDDIKKQYLENAEHNLKEFLVTHEIAIKENLTATDADVDAKIKELADMYHMAEEEVRNIVGKNIDNLKNQIQDEKIANFVKSHNGEGAPKKAAASKAEKKEGEEAPKAKKAPAKKKAETK